uniref:Uncharacterized protein n=1 Tax=Oryza brachyantha TaxID=4533 RepID=J3MJQ5_ORYBR
MTIASRASSPAGIGSALERARQMNAASTSKVVARLPRPRRCGGRAPLSAATSAALKEKVRMSMSPRATAGAGVTATSSYSGSRNSGLGGLRASRSSRHHTDETAGSQPPRARSATASMNCTIPDASHMTWLRRIPRTNPPHRRRVTWISSNGVPSTPAEPSTSKRS